MARPKMKKVFYNHKIKEAFIALQPETMHPNYKTLFSKTKEIEEKKGKDIYDFTFTEITDFYRYLNKGSVNGLWMTHTELRKYMRWAEENKYTTNPDIIILNSLQSSSLSTYCNNVALKNSVISRDDIVSWTEELRKSIYFYNPRESFMILGPFEGITGYRLCELIDIKQEDIYKKDGCYYAKLSNRTIKISKELYDIAMECIQEDYRYILTRGLVRKTELENTGRIVKPIVSKNTKSFTYNSIANNVKSALKTIDEGHVTIRQIIMSGRIHMIKEKSKEHKLSWGDYIKSQYFKDEVCYQFNMNTDDGTISNFYMSFKTIMRLF